jgi:acetyltransferase-like isoleucine patch superfamily enzyme
MRIKNITTGIILLIPRICNLISFKIHSVTYGSNCVINGRLRLYGKGRLILGDNVRINSRYRNNPIGGNRSTSIYIKQNAIVRIGDNTGLSNVAIYAAQKINVGDYVKIGGNVCIYDTDFHSLDYQDRMMKNEPNVKSAPVEIRNNVFIGANSIILKGVVIGEKSIIGAGSVVTKQISANEIWAGNPARFIRKIEKEVDTFD